MQGPNAEPLWPALARRWARCPTEADRALLEDLARHPERREPPLSWGLRFFARGDVWLQDDRVVTLDELCDQVGNPALPYVEEIEPDVAIEWE